MQSRHNSKSQSNLPLTAAALRQCSDAKTRCVALCQAWIDFENNPNDETQAHLRRLTIEMNRDYWKVDKAIVFAKHNIALARHDDAATTKIDSPA